jgi:hypothetical protein
MMSLCREPWNHPDPVATGSSVTAANDEEGVVCSEPILLAHAGPSRIWAMRSWADNRRVRGMPTPGEAEDEVTDPTRDTTAVERARQP